MLEGDAHGARRPSLLNFQSTGVDLQNQTFFLKLIVDVAAAIRSRELGTAPRSIVPATFPSLPSITVALLLPPLNTKTLEVAGS
jgi:hypothetical protein